MESRFLLLRYRRILRGLVVGCTSSFRYGLAKSSSLEIAIFILLLSFLELQNPIPYFLLNPLARTGTSNYNLAVWKGRKGGTDEEMGTQKRLGHKTMGGILIW